jgi:hypothetical protein
VFARCGSSESSDLQGFHAGGGTRTPDTRIMIPDKQGSVRSDSPSQAPEGQFSSSESRELGARSGAQARRKRKRRKG